MKKITAIVFTLVLAFCLLPTSAFAVGNLPQPDSYGYGGLPQPDSYFDYGYSDSGWSQSDGTSPDNYTRSSSVPNPTITTQPTDVVGSIGGVEDGVVGAGEIADPEECAKITALGIDFLAAGIGNIHGVYPANWKGLDFEALDRIHKATNNIPLVLHGGTGIPDDMIAKAISLGVSKININTECQLVFAEATRKYIEEGKDQQGKGFDPRKLLAPGAKAIEAKCKEKIELFGCAGKG